MSEFYPELYVVATPIGNLKDISFRALEVLKNVDLILAEDSRVSQKILSYYNIKTPVLSYHQHSKIEKVNYILDLLKNGKRIALVSDSGTPGVSDPGNKLINLIINDLELKNIKVIPVPGPCALISAASVSGFPMDRFLFLGFLPRKKKRKDFLLQIVNSRYPTIFYESPYRIIKTLNDLDNLDKDLEVVVCRELTKKFETIYRGKIKEVIKRITPKGEFTVIAINKHLKKDKKIW